MAGVSYVNELSEADLTRMSLRGRSALPHPMAVGLRRGGELAGEIDERDELLAAGFEIPELDLATGQLVAENHGEMGVIASGRFELFAELAGGELGANR